MQHRLSNFNADAMLADCRVCGEQVPVKIKPSKDYPLCLEKQRELARNRRKVNRKSPFHGLTKTEAHALKTQYPCMICGETVLEKLHVDHDHSSGLIRGVLCNRHNMALGLFQDNIEHLALAIEYLKEPPLAE